LQTLWVHCRRWRSSNQSSTRCLRRQAFPVSLQPIPRPYVIRTGSAEQLVTYNTDAIDRMVEKWNLANLLRWFSHSGSSTPCDHLRAAPQRYRIFFCDATVREKPVGIMTLWRWLDGRSMIMSEPHEKAIWCWCFPPARSKCCVII
jgi:hypothetical protein